MVYKATLTTQRQKMTVAVKTLKGYFLNIIAM